MNRAVFPKFLNNPPSLFGVTLQELIISFGISFILKLFGIDDDYLFLYILGILFLLVLKRKVVQPSFFFHFFRKKRSIDKINLLKKIKRDLDEIK